jgi:flagellar hook-associated protein 2
MSGAISFSGLFSGLDVDSIVEKLLEIERQPLYVIENRQSEEQDRLSVYQDLQSRLSSLDSTILSLNSALTLGAKLASSSNTTALTASANSSAAIGTYTIDSITTLAKAASEASIGVSDKTADFVSGSSFSFDVGTETVTINLTEDQTTLEGLRDAINSQAGDLVTASIVNTGDANDPYKLIIRSDETGAANDISNFSTDIVVSTSGGDTALSFVSGESVQGVDAVFKINGVQISRGSNTISDVIDGLTLTLNGKTDDPVTVTVSADTDTIKSALNDFITAYNDVNSLIQAQFSYDEETGSAGVLSGDATLRQIQSSLQSLVVRGITDADGNRYSLATIGVSIDKYSGELSLDEDKMATAIESDSSLLFNLFLARGAASDSRVSYAGSTDSTTEGVYSINITGWDGNGNVQGTFTLDGQVYTGVGNGQYLSGPAGSPAEGLKIKITDGATGDLGTITYTVGVAEMFERKLDDFITPLDGLLPKLQTSLEKEIANMDDQITAFEERLATRETQLYAEFTAAEEAIAQLQSIQSTLDQQFGSS